MSSRRLKSAVAKKAGGGKESKESSPFEDRREKSGRNGKDSPLTVAKPKFSRLSTFAVDSDEPAPPGMEEQLKNVVSGYDEDVNISGTLDSLINIPVCLSFIMFYVRLT